MTVVDLGLLRDIGDIVGLGLLMIVLDASIRVYCKECGRVTALDRSEISHGLRRHIIAQGGLDYLLNELPVTKAKQASCCNVCLAQRTFARLDDD